MNEFERRAENALRKIKIYADNAVLGGADLTSEYVMDTDNHRHCWRTYMGIIWALVCDGLGLTLPRPPAWPPEPPKPCTMYRPCPDCPLLSGADGKADAGQKGGD